MAVKPLFRIQIVAKALIKAITARVKDLTFSGEVAEGSDGEPVDIPDIPAPGVPVEGRALVIVRYSMTQGNPNTVAPADNTAGKNKVLALIGGDLRLGVSGTHLARVVRDRFGVDLPTLNARQALTDMLEREPERLGVKSIERAGPVLGTATVENLIVDFDGNPWDGFEAEETLTELVQKLNAR